MKIINLLVCASVALGAAPAYAAPAYPDRPISLISPHQAGGATDLFARLVSDKMADDLGQPIVIHARPGAGGTIGARSVSVSKPDGYTLLANPSMHVMYSGMFKSLQFDPMRDFMPIGMLGSSPMIVVVNAASPYKTFADLLTAARDKQLSFASGALGSLPHLVGELVNQHANVKMTHIPYNGTGPALTDLAGGHVDVLYAPVSNAEPLIKSGQLRALAVTSQERVTTLPDVPTAAEAGMPNLDVSMWYGLWAPKDTPAAVVERLNASLRRASTDPVVLERMKGMHVTPSDMSVEAFTAYTQQESERWLKVMRDAGIEPQ